MTPGAARGKAPEVVLRGGPHRLAGSLPSAGEPRPRVSVSLEGVAVGQVMVFPPDEEEPDRLRFAVNVPRTTPPGRYEGTVMVGERAVPIAAEVEPRLKLRSDPRRIEVTARPTSSEKTSVRLRNVGNVPCEIAPKSTFCLFDGVGFEHAFWVALDVEPTPERRRVDVLFDDLADYHGGLVRLRVTNSEAPLAAGEAREVKITLQFSDRLRPSRHYVGAWDLDGLRVPIRVTTIGSSSPGQSESEAA